MALSRKVVVVTRRLPGHDSVVSAIIGVDTETEKGLDDVEHYLQEKAEQHIRLFKDDFIEFRNAEWSHSFMLIKM